MKLSSNKLRLANVFIGIKFIVVFEVGSHFKAFVKTLEMMLLYSFICTYIIKMTVRPQKGQYDIS